MRRPKTDEYSPVSTGSGGASMQQQVVEARFRRNVYLLVGAACMLLAAVYIHNMSFYSALSPLVDQVTSMEHYVLQTQKDVREDIFELLHNIR